MYKGICLVLLAAVCVPIGTCAETNLIDHYIFEKIARDKVPVTELSSDSEFLRRLHLELTGRREVFRLGALTISGFRLLPFAAPSQVRAQGRATARGSADCVIFLNLQGGPPQMDTFDVKEGKWGPQNSVLGIDWTKRIAHTPSGRDFVYVDPAAGQAVIDFREVADLFI